MSWTLLFVLVLALGLSLLLALARRAELRRMHGSIKERERAERQGAGQAQLLHPIVDLSRCLGCATCVAVCPEEDVLGIVHGQAMVVNPARCQGISACERECPVGAITVTLANVETRNDIPAVSDKLEAAGTPGLFLAGEVTAHALIKTAIEHGAAVGSEVARRVRANGSNGALDLCIVGAGPAGLACSLEAKRHGLRFVTIDQAEQLGGTVAKYPRRKLVMTQPVDLPLVGRLKKTEYTKEELIDLWQGIALEHDLPILAGQTFEALDRAEDGTYVVRTETGTYTARHVCLAVGRRGVPQRLDIPGEELPKVTYHLLDAGGYKGRRVLVVGGGDSAVEAAIGLAEQGNTRVTLSYRKENFYRIRTKNEQRLAAARARGNLEVVFQSEVTEIRPDTVDLVVRNGRGDRSVTLPNDDVFIMAGGIPPFELLARSGVSFDASQREAPAPVVEQGSGLVRAIAVAFALAVATLGFALWHSDYYFASSADRPLHDAHATLRPGRGAGLWLGITAAALIVLNLLYLLRRSPRIKFNYGSLQLWMTSHVATGILALLCATLHSAMTPKDTVGGHAFWALAVLLLTGAVGRYFYAYVPRAANGRELELAEVKARLAHVSEEWSHGQRRFGERVRKEVDVLIDRGQWRGSFFGRVAAFFGEQRELRRILIRLRDQGRSENVPGAQIRETLSLARRAHQISLMAAHYEDLRAILASWRYLHRWIAALMVLLVVLHILHSLAYGAWGSA
ncbi:MAG: NAD(P)-binding domain-containing protein [Planctomycetota bacterium]|nr:NAD(P)-binding domain-containing protein [Planctomycetota bacterium]